MLDKGLSRDTSTSGSATDERMDIVYKYCCAGGIEILENLELKVTPPNQFNDPFEFTPRMICSAPLRRTREILKTKRHLRTLYDAEVAAGRFSGNFREYREYAKKHRQKIAEGIAVYLPEAAAETGRHVLDKASRKYGILCLSKTRESILMWGHYCDKHCGLVIGFDGAHKIFGVPTPVKYVRERVLFDASWLERDARVRAFEKQLVFSKYMDWAYEQEVRQMFNLPALKQKQLKDGTLGYFLTVPPQAIVRVTLGARCPNDLTNKVLKALQNPTLAHVKLDRAVLHDSDFALRFERLGAQSMNAQFV